MAQAQRNSDWDADVRPGGPAWVESTTAMAVPSPARALQQLLEQRTSLARDEARWSRRRAAVFVVAASASLWLALLAAAHGAMTAVA